MVSEGIQKIEAVGTPVSFMRPGAPGARSWSQDKTEAIGAGGRAGSPVSGQAKRAGDREAEPIDLGSKAGLANAPALAETYVRIRYDRSSGRYLIQFRNLSDDTVVREIPPEAWSKSSGNIPLPKGMIVETEQ